MALARLAEGEDGGDKSNSKLPWTLSDLFSANFCTILLLYSQDLYCR